MSRPDLRASPSIVVGIVLVVAVAACKRSEPPPDITKTQREAMERSKEVGTTMQKGVDERGKQADAEGR